MEEQLKTSLQDVEPLRKVGCNHSHFFIDFACMSTYCNILLKQDVLNHFHRLYTHLIGCTCVYV